MDGFDVVVRVARLTLASSGEGVETLETYVATAARAYGVDAAVVVLPEQVVLTDTVSGATTAVAVVRAAPSIFRLDQMQALKRVLARAEDGQLPADEACRMLDAIEAQPQRWPAWVRAVGVGLFAAGFAPSVVASWSEVAASAVLGVLMGALVVACTGRRVEGMVPFLGAFTLTLLAVTAGPELVTRTGVTLMVLPALFIVVPGDTLSAAAAELLGGRITAGASRLVYASFVLGLIVVGIVAAAEAAGRPDALVETLPAPTLPVLVVLLGWVVFSVGLVLAFDAEPGLVGWLVPSVIATYALQQGVTRLAGQVFGTLVAGAVLGAFANLVSGPSRRPPRLLLILGGFFVLTVGGVGIRGVTSILGGDVVTGLQHLVDFGIQVPTVALSMALGILATSPRLRDRPGGFALRRVPGWVRDRTQRPRRRPRTLR